MFLILFVSAVYFQLHCMCSLSRCVVKTFFPETLSIRVLYNTVVADGVFFLADYFSLSDLKIISVNRARVNVLSEFQQSASVVTCVVQFMFIFSFARCRAQNVYTSLFVYVHIFQ